MKSFVLGLFVALMALVAPTASSAQEIHLPRVCTSTLMACFDSKTGDMLPDSVCNPPHCTDGAVLNIGTLPPLTLSSTGTSSGTLAVPVVTTTDGWPLHAAVAFEIIASGVDGYTTMYLDGQDSVRAPRTAEVSPVLAPFSNQPITMAVMKTGIAVAVGWLLIKYHAENPRVAFWTAAILGGVYTWAGIHNQKLIASVNQ